MKTRTIRTKILSLLLAAIMVFSLLPVTALAATVDNSYTPGTYEGTAQGFKGAVNVTVTLEKDGENVVISDITAAREAETESYWETAIALLDKIKEKNGTDGIDAKCGATFSATGIINATNEALSKAVSGFVGGTGTQDAPYLISSEAGLRYLQAQVASGDNYAGKYIKLTSDIALTGEWTPIGSSTAAFAGSFDGGGHTISGMTITDSTLGYAGLFGYTLNGVVIKNVKLTGVSIDMPAAAQTVYAAALVGFIKNGTGSTVSSVDNCYASGSITVKNADKLTIVGGLAAFTDQRAAVTNCGTDVAINAASGTGRATVGGFVAWASIQALFMNDYSLGNVIVATECDKYDNFGAMFGQVNGIIYNCYTSGNITLNSTNAPTPAGAIAGNLAAATYIDSCYYASDADKFGTASGSSNDATVLKKTADEMKGEEFATLLHDNLAPAALDAMSANVTKAKVKDCPDFGALTARVDNKFYDWTVSNNTVVLASTLWSSADIDASIFASGDGTEESPYIIETADQLRAFAGSLNDKIDYTGKYVQLGDNINVSDKAWTPIGGSDYAFNGTFDGANYEISGMKLGAEDAPYALDSENIYIGLFGVLGSKAYVKNVKVDIAFYTSYEKNTFLGGIVGYMDGNRTNGDYTGAVIDSCYVSGTIKHTGEKGNQFIGGIVGMQYKGEIINSASKVTLTGIVKSGDLAEVGGLVGLNNRGLVANCWSDSAISGSGNRENGNEGMAVVSNLVACNAGDLVNCYASGNVTTAEHSVYAGMVSGWVTGIGKSYNCWYNLESEMVVGGNTVSPVESIGTKVASGVTEDGDAYTGGLVDKMSGVKGADAATAEALNASFAAFPIDINAKFKLSENSLKKWTFDNTLDFGDETEKVSYVKPDCENYVKPELKLNDGTWYGRDDEKTTVVSIEVKNGVIVETTVISGETSGEAYDAAVEKAEYKSTYGDFSHYEAADTSKFSGGSGTAADPYIIANAEQLKYLSSSINADVDWKGVYFKQTANITLRGQWQPIGWALNGEVNGAKTPICAYPFRGNYDGGGYSIYGLTIGSESAPVDMMTAGLFGFTAGAFDGNNAPTGSEQTVTIKNVNLKNVYINVSTRYETYVGGLVGNAQNGIYIDNCTVSGKVSSTTSESFSRAGGLAGSILRGSVTNCGADVEVKGVTDTNHVYAGGFYGMDNRVTTYNCYALGNVYGNSSNNNKVHIGGFVGQAGGVHYNCYAAGSEIVSAKTTTDVGAFSGRNSGINVDYYCYCNSNSLVKQGDTEEYKAVGVITTNAVVENCEGKTVSELKSADFAKLMTENASAKKAAEANKFINEQLLISGSGLTQQNYYTGNALFGWLADGSSYAYFCKHTGEVITDAAVEATCTKTGLTEGTHCADCGMAIIAQEETPKLDHTFKYGECTVCGAEDPDYNPPAPPRPVHRHTVVVDAAVAATCTETGLTEGSHCSTCNAVIKAQEVVPALGHKEELKNAKAATCTEAGYTGDKVCSVCGVTVEKGSELKALGHKFSDGVCSECGAKDPTYNPFKDVSKDAFYYDAVLWAVANDVTEGTSDTTFSPDEGCTRAQIVTFLYRASGDKVTAKAAFNDVAASAWYAEAVTWAVANGITKGTGANAFSPDLTCTRAQAVTLIYRAQ